MKLETSTLQVGKVPAQTKTSDPLISGPSRGNARVFVHVPCQALRPFVKRLVIVEFPFDRRLKLLPDTSFTAEFRFQGDYAFNDGANLPRATVSGLWDTARSRAYTGGTAILLVMFTESGAMSFLREPLDTFFNTNTSAETVLNGTWECGLFDEQLATAKDHARRAQIAEAFLLDHIHNVRMDPFVSNAVARIEETEAGIRIEELARRVGLSQSALERRFRRNVGTSPKQFASILRLKNAFRLRAGGRDFTSIAYSAGYSDQSHFTNEFKRVTGLAPSAFFQQSAVCSNSASLQVAFAAN
jgi:AraC-like DNA-binding protein